MPGAGAAITLVAVVALLSALNANLYGASRMVYSLSERGEAPRFLLEAHKARVPVVAVGVSVAFGFLAAVLELLFPDQILPALFQLVGSTCLVVWGSALVSQLILRRRADRDGTALPLRMKGFPGLTVFGLVLLAPDLRRGLQQPGQQQAAVQHPGAGGRHRRGVLDRRPDHGTAGNRHRRHAVAATAVRAEPPGRRVQVVKHQGRRPACSLRRSGQRSARLIAHPAAGD